MGPRFKCGPSPGTTSENHFAHHLCLNEMTLHSSLVPGGVCPSSTSIPAMKCPDFSSTAYQLCDPREPPSVSGLKWLVIGVPALCSPSGSIQTVDAEMQPSQGYPLTQKPTACPGTRHSPGRENFCAVEGSSLAKRDFCKGVQFAS